VGMVSLIVFCHLSLTQTLTPSTVSAEEDVAEEDSEDTIVDKDANWTPGSKGYKPKPKKAKVELAPFADERYFSDSESDSDWSDDEASMIDPFNIADDYDAGDDEVSAGIILGNTRDFCQWFEDETLDEPIPFTLEPTCDKKLDGSPVIQEEGDEDEVVEIEDVWGYDGAEDDKKNVLQGWEARPEPLFYMKELWPRSARDLYTAWWET